METLYQSEETERVFQNFLAERPFEETISYFNTNPKETDLLFEWSSSRTPREQNYASWILLHWSEKKKDCIDAEYVDKATDLFLQTKHPSVLRNMAGFLANAKRGQIENGAVLDHSLQLIIDSNSLPAQIYQCLRLVDKHFFESHPALRNELLACLDLLNKRKEPSVQSMCKNFGKKWSKIK